MELCRRGEGVKRRPGFPKAPTVEVLFGGDDGGPAVGVVRVVVPAGAGMPEHDHGGSDVVLLPQVGSVEISSGEETIQVAAGDAALVRREERVSLRNPNQTDAEVIVAAAPPAFLASIRAWPAASAKN